MPELLVATRNSGKLREIATVLKAAHPTLTLRSLEDFPGVPIVVEDGASFLENARKKAMIVSTFAKRLALADDSGLEVDALGGRPGVFSARFAGVGATDEENVAKLLAKMEGASNRTARFRCVMALCTPEGKCSTATGDLEGEITISPRGRGGFGYDPVFLIPSLGRTLAELTLGEKNRMSHRSKALAKIATMLTHRVGA